MPENLTECAKVGMTSVLTKNGLGKDCWPSLHDYKLAHISQIVYSPIICITKVSILILLLRIFGPKRRMYIAINILIWANVLFYMAGLFVQIFQCNPRDKAWDSHIPGKCVDERAAQFASAVVNTFSDFAILILPIKTTWDLNLPSKRKLWVLAILGTGFMYVTYTSSTLTKRQANI